MIHEICESNCVAMSNYVDNNLSNYLKVREAVHFLASYFDAMLILSLTTPPFSTGVKYAAVLLVTVVAVIVAQEDYKSDYFQYTNVKGPKEFAYGYSRGNPHHHRTHHQRNKDHTFQAKVQ